MKDIFNIKSKIDKEKVNDLWLAYNNGILVKENFTIFALCDYQRVAGKEGHAVFFTKRQGMLEKYNTELKKIMPDDLYETFAEAMRAFGSVQETEVCSIADQVLGELQEVLDEIIKDYASKRKII